MIHTKYKEMVDNLSKTSHGDVNDKVIETLVVEYQDAEKAR